MSTLRAEALQMVEEAPESQLAEIIQFIKGRNSDRASAEQRKPQDLSKFHAAAGEIRIDEEAVQSRVDARGGFR